VWISICALHIANHTIRHMCGLHTLWHVCSHPSNCILSYPPPLDTPPLGNRVTLRDWLNLTVKEGLTVYREQQFMADLDAAAAAVTAPTSSTDWEPQLLSHLYRIAAAGSGDAPAAAAVAGQSAPASTAAAAGGGCAGAPVPGCSWRRVLEACHLREAQWPEDDGPLAHPIRPSQVTSLCSLYTDTVYAKVGVWESAGGGGAG
jgi:aminopeptidase N